MSNPVTARSSRSTMASATLLAMSLFAPLLLASCDSEPKISRLDIQFVDPAAGRKMVEQKRGLLGLGAPIGVWLDPREPEEFARGHIAGALNIPFLKLESRLDLLDGLSTIVVYGDDANDSRTEATAKKLIRIGYPGVRMLDGGLQAWTSAGNELETGG